MYIVCILVWLFVSKAREETYEIIVAAIIFIKESREGGIPFLVPAEGSNLVLRGSFLKFI